MLFTQSRRLTREFCECELAMAYYIFPHSLIWYIVINHGSQPFTIDVSPAPDQSVSSLCIAPLFVGTPWTQSQRGPFRCDCKICGGMRLCGGAT